MKTGIPTNGSMVKNHISFKTGFRYLATRRVSFLLWFQACQIRLQGSHCATSSSSSSSSPTVSDTKTREREDRIERDISPVTVSTTVDERSGRPDNIKPVNFFFEKKKKTTGRTGRPVVERTERPVIF